MGTGECDDAMLLNMLRLVIDETDPVPDDVVATARAVFRLHPLMAAAGQTEPAADPF